MRNFWQIFIVLLILLRFNGIEKLASQTTWYKYPGNPVFYGGSANDWDNTVYTKSIIFSQGMYQMWYCGIDIHGKQRIGYATSQDGIRWEKYGGNPIGIEFGGSGWESGIHHFCVLYTDSLYYLWYTGFNKDPSLGTCLGLARSGDGMVWEKLTEPVLIPEPEHNWDVLGFVPFSVLYRNNSFHMWYTGIAGSINPLFSVLKVGYATSKDGINWNKYSGNPIFSTESTELPDDNQVMLNSVVYNGSGFDMWYSYWNGVCWQIGQAASYDGMVWTDSGKYPVLGAGELGSWDSWHAASPLVILRDSVFHLWYNGEDKTTKHYGYATTSRDLAMQWEKDSINVAPKFIWVRAFNREERVATDSLERIVPELSGREKADALNKLALAYSLYKPEQSSDYARQAINIAGSVDYPRAKAMALYVLGNSQYVMDRYTEALRNQLHALRIYDSLDMGFEAGNIYSQIASIQTYAGSHDLAGKYYEKALQEFLNIKDTISAIFTLGHLGLAQLKNGDTSLAVKTFNRRVYYSLQTRKYARLAESHEALGQCYTGKILDSAIYYLKSAAVIWDSIYMRKHLSFTNLLLAEAYEEAGVDYYDHSFMYYMKSVNERRSAHWFRVRLYYHLARLEFKMGDYPKARIHLDNANRLCQNYLRLKDHRMFNNLNKKMEFEMEHIPYMANIHHLYFQLDTVFHNEQDALFHYMTASHWKDSIHDDQSRKQWAMMQGEYETEKAENKIVVLEKENEVNRMKVRQSRIYLFAMGAFIIILGLIAVLFIRQNKIRAEQKNVLLEQKMLRLQMNPHFIFNALSGIMEFIDKKMNDLASTYLSTFANLMRSTLESTRKDFIYLDEEVNWLSNYMELQKLRYADNFQYSIIVDDKLDPGDVRIPPMLIQPFVENAIEHGIRHKNTPGHISVSFRLHNNMIKCEVEDDGVGRAKAWEIEHKTRKKHSSMATDIIMDRIHAINKKMKHKIKLNIVDMMSESNEAIGTKVILDMPYI